MSDYPTLAEVIMAGLAYHKDFRMYILGSKLYIHYNSNMQMFDAPEQFNPDLIVAAFKKPETVHDTSKVAMSLSPDIANYDG